MITRRNFLGMSLVGASYLSAPANFSLPLFGKLKSSLKIGYLTDLHAFKTNQTEQAFERILKSIKSEAPDLILGGGDWISDGWKISAEEATKRLKKFKEFWTALPKEKCLVPGNHDFVRSTPGVTPDLTLFKSIVSDLSFTTSYDLEKFKLITIQNIKFSSDFDSETPYKGEVEEDQLTWLKSELEETDSQTPIILLLHIPLVSLFFQRTQGELATPNPSKVLSSSVEVLKLFDKHNLALVLQGHLHVSEFMTWNKTSFITGGALCGKWWQGDNFGTPPGWGIVTLSQGKAEWDYKTY